MERRSHFRVSPSETEPIVVTNLAGFLEVEDVIVRNISHVGVCLSFSINPNTLYMKDMLGFELDLGAAGLLKLEGYPRYIFQSPDGRYELGLELLNLTATARQTLVRYVDSRLREETRKT